MEVLQRHLVAVQWNASAAASCDATLNTSEDRAVLLDDPQRRELCQPSPQAHDQRGALANVKLVMETAALRCEREDPEDRHKGGCRTDECVRKDEVPLVEAGLLARKWEIARRREAVDRGT